MNVCSIQDLERLRNLHHVQNEMNKEAKNECCDGSDWLLFWWLDLFFGAFCFVFCLFYVFIGGQKVRSAFIYTIITGKKHNWEQSQ